MEVILLKNLDNLGFKHDLVSVKNGYGQNYLIPQKLAVIANATNKEKLSAILEKEKAAELAKLGEYQELAKSLAGKTLKIGVKAGTSGKIFGSVTSIQVANALRDQLEVELDRRKIILEEDIKEVGSYKVALNLHPEVQSEIDIDLIAE